MNTWMNTLLTAVVLTGDDEAERLNKLVILLVIVGVVFVAMAVASVIVSKKRKAEDAKAIADSKEDKKEEK